MVKLFSAYPELFKCHCVLSDVDSKSRIIYWTDKQERKIFSQTLGEETKNEIITMGIY